jgi:flagellar motor switch protein FliN
MADEMNPEDFGLGSEFDDALNEASGGGDANAEENPRTRSDEARLAKADFSKLKMILDVPLKVSVELGRTKMLINDLLQLGQGSVIELDKIAGEPMEILINDKLVAMGEVVVVNEKFGVRLTDVVSQFGLQDVSNAE